jgi:hypothetical protein
MAQGDAVVTTIVPLSSATPAMIATGRFPPSESSLRLVDLPTDVLSKLYEHVIFQFVLKSVCRALRAAGPKETETRLSLISQAPWIFILAYRVGCPFVWDAKLSAKLARRGSSFATLRWARKEGLPWDGETCAAAARYGHVGIVRWAHSAGCFLDVNEVAAQAARGGHVHMLEWLTQFPIFRPDQWMATMAARGGHLVTLKWLHGKGCRMHRWVIANAAWRGDLEMIKWLRSVGAKWRSPAVTWAAMRGHLETVVWMVQNGCPWDENARVEAYRNGHYSIVTFLSTDAAQLTHITTPAPYQ